MAGLTITDHESSNDHKQTQVGTENKQIKWHIGEINSRRYKENIEATQHKDTKHNEQK